MMNVQFLVKIRGTPEHCNTDWETEGLKEGDCLMNIGIDGRIILK
jgi:hypothetical protein